jgi:hypothetical protein
MRRGEGACRRAFGGTAAVSGYVDLEMTAKGLVPIHSTTSWTAPPHVHPGWPAWHSMNRAEKGRRLFVHCRATDLIVAFGPI